MNAHFSNLASVTSALLESRFCVISVSAGGDLPFFFPSVGRGIYLTTELLSDTTEVLISLNDT